MNFYRFLIVGIIATFISGCVGEDYKLWGAGRSGSYTYRDIKATNAGKTLYTVIYTNPARLSQDIAEEFVLSGLSKRYESDTPERKVSFSSNPIEATTSATKLIVQFDMAKNQSPQKLCNVTTPLPFRAVTESTPLHLSIIYCKNDKAEAWIRGESLPTSKVTEDLIELIAQNALHRMSSPSFTTGDKSKN